MKLHPEIIWEDDQIICLNKPAGMLSIADRFDSQALTASQFLENHLGGEKVFTVHRLDRETSGVLLFAKNSEAHRNLSMQFEHRKTHKEYLAICNGYPTENSGIIEKAIEENPLKRGSMRIARIGKYSVTEWEVQQRFQEFSLIKCTIGTGRMHQIRVHLAWLGHPLAIDSLYGTRSQLLLSTIKKRYKLSVKEDDERPLMNRLTLHAARLSLLHPTTNLPIEIVAEMPKDFNAVLTQLSKWGALKK
jgi:23S rRNA pseudouridine955/2504/2580 synthase/23S rRNA pseudouridine1911/1915/1917 synthase